MNNRITGAVIVMNVISRLENADRPLIGVAWMLVTMFWFASLDALAKYMMQSYPVAQVVWARFFFHVIFVLIAMGFSARLQIRSQSIVLQCSRSLFMLTTTVLFFVGVHLLPLATAATIMFVSPIFVTILSIFLLKEHVGVRRWAGVAIGFAGAIVVVRPGFEDFDWSATFVLAAALTHAFYQIFTRKVRLYDSPMTSLFYTGLVGALVMTVVVPFHWQSVDVSDYFLLVSLGAAGGVGHLCLIRAFRSAPASTVAPFSYTSLIWATMFGYVLFSDLPDRWTLIGACLIISSGLYIFHRERVTRHNQGLT
ncbi:MAG: DMT family transporter [Gammaproteobacteria bacterium]|nr:DMT family transporter [Gammaproteobacteria bacterium]MDH3467692.1 DMT family transporter [Gammaproteobacteria bacterium]